METHGGYGKLFNGCYSDISEGIVFEKNPVKAAALGKQRPEWAVYEADCINALKAGVGSHLECNFIDIDPHGSAWDVIDAYLSNDSLKPELLVMVVNCGMRTKLKLGGADVTALSSAVMKHGGSNLYTIYLEICEELLTEKAAKAGYNLDHFFGYYCGHADQMTHYYARLKKARLVQ